MAAAVDAAVKNSRNTMKRILNENSSAKLSRKEKAEVIEAVAKFSQFGESIYNKSDIREVAKSIVELCNRATNLALQEQDDWFDGVTVKRDIKEISGLLKEFTKAATESLSTQQRLESLYEDLGNKLGRYYEISEGNAFGAARAKAIAAGEDSFEVDGETFPVKDVDAEDKKNAKDFANEALELGLEALKEEKYVIVDPKGNPRPVGSKMQGAMMSKKLGGPARGYHLVLAKNAKAARNAIEKSGGDATSAAVQDIMFDLMYEAAPRMKDNKAVSAIRTAGQGLAQANNRLRVEDPNGHAKVQKAYKKAIEAVQAFQSAVRRFAKNY